MESGEGQCLEKRLVDKGKDKKGIRVTFLENFIYPIEGTAQTYLDPSF